jgi:colanic acid biosynthesis glycosyl transferase WcaI
MNILIISQYFWPENFRINDLTQELIERGHNVTVLTGKPNYPSGNVFYDYRKNKAKFANYMGANIIRVPMFARGKGTLRLILNYLSFVIGASICGPWLLRREQPDVIFVFEPSPVTVGLPAILLGRIKKTPIVFWVLDLWPDTLAAIGVIRSQKLLAAVGKLVKFIYENCTLLLGQSNSFLEDIGKYCYDKNKIHYFPSWAEDIFSIENTSPAPEVQPSKNVFNILFAGNIGEAQDIPAILKAAHQLRNNTQIRWLFVGDGRKYNWLQEEVIRLELENTVLLLGRYPLERMPSFYAHADALLVTLKKDPVFSKTIPGKLQSYLLSGVPILGMIDGEGADVINKSKAGLCCSGGDSDGLATQILNLSSMDIIERKTMGERGRAFAEKEFGKNHLINRLEDLFQKAILKYKN